MSNSELIITAEGDVNYFDKVNELVKGAPLIEGWRIIAFKPSQKIDFVTSYEGVKVDSRQIWFLPLLNSKRANKIGLRIGIPNYTSKQEKLFLLATYQALDAALGEKSSTLYIDYVEVSHLPEDPSSNGYIEFFSLPEYVEWKISKMQ